MRYSLLPTLGAVISLGVTGVFANVVCDTGLDLGINSTSTAIAAKDCIERACASRVAGGNVAEECGSVVFAITHVGTSLPDVATCIGQFSSIVDQCIVSGVAQTGTVATEQAIYEIYEAGGEDLQARGLNDYLEDDDLNWEDIVWDDDEEEDTDVRSLERRAREKRVLKTKDPKKTKSKTQPKPTNPKTKETKNKTDAKKEQQGQACKNPNAKDNGTTAETGTNGKTKTGTKPKKTTRDIIDDYLPQILRRGGSPGSSSHGSSSHGSSHSSPGQNCAVDITQWYKIQDLERGRVRHWRFKTRTGWRDHITEQAYPQVRAVMRMMNRDGKLDVIEMRSAQTEIVGRSNGRTNPHDYARGTGKYVLCNGGFFIMGGATGMRYDVGGQSLDARQLSHYSVGDTSVTQYHVPIPQSQSEYYGRLVGDDGSWLWSGPTLSRQLDLNKPELKYFDSDGTPSAYTRIPGGVATSNQPNERLVTVLLPNGTKYLFVYTSKRADGCDMNQMRELIKIFLDKYMRFNIRNAKQVLNLDGGGSIYVSWVSRGREYVIAGGNIGGVTPATIPEPRVVTTMVQFKV